MNDFQENKRVEDILSHYNQHYSLLKRKSDFKRVATAFSLSQYEDNLLSELAETFGVNKSEFVRVCLHYFVTSIRYK